MPSKPRRSPQKKRKRAKTTRRPRWVVRVVLVAAAFLVVFCAAAATSIWFAQGRSGPSQPAPSGSATDAERLTQGERSALDRVLHEQNPATKP